MIYVRRGTYTHEGVLDGYRFHRRTLIFFADNSNIKNVLFFKNTFFFLGNMNIHLRQN